MRLFTSMRPSESLELLRESADRNSSVELHFERGGQVSVGKCRILAVRDDDAVVERPTFSSGMVECSPGQEVTVYLMLGATRYSFRSRVAEPRFMFTLRQEVRLPAMTLELPCEIEKNQRRRNFRVSLGARYDIPILFHGAEGCAHHEVPIDAEHFKGRMIDLSTGGMRALVGCEERAAFRLGERFYSEFVLPASQTTYRPMCRVCYLRSVRDGEAHQVGVQFIPWEGFVQGMEHHRLQSWITEEQRRQLQKSVTK